VRARRDGIASRAGILLMTALYRATGKGVMRHDGDFTPAATFVMPDGSLVFLFPAPLTVIT
jgi:hypothetical protein